METLVHENTPHGAPLVRVIKRFAGSHRNKELALEIGQPVWIVRRAKLVNQRGTWWIGYDARGRRGVFPEECIDVRDVDPEQLKRAAAGDTRKLLEARRQRQGSRSRSPPPKHARVVDYALRAGTFHIELRPSLTVSHASLFLPDASSQHLDTFAAGIIETSTQEDADNHVEADALGTWTDTHISISRALADIAKQSSIDSSTLMELKIDDDSTRQSKVWRLSLFPFLKYPATIFGLSTSVRIWFSANAEARPLASVSMLGEAKVQVQLKCLQDVDIFLEKARLNLGIIPVIRDGDVSTNDLHQPGTMMETSSLNLASGQPIVIGKSSFCRVSKLDANFGHLALLLRDSDGTVAGHAEVSLARLSRTPDRHVKLKLHTETTVGSVKSVAAILSAKVNPALDQEISHAPPSPQRMPSPTKHKRSTPAGSAQIELASPILSEFEHKEDQAQRRRGRSPHKMPSRGESPASRDSRSPSRETRVRERPRVSKQAHHEIQQKKILEQRQSRRHQTSPQRHSNATASPSSQASKPWSPHPTHSLESPGILSARGKKAKDSSPRSKMRSESLSLVQQAQQGLNELLAPPLANHNQDVHEAGQAWASRAKPGHDLREGFQQDSTSVDPSLTAQIQLGLRQLLHNHVADWQNPSLSQIQTHSHLAVDVQDSSSPSSSSSSSSPSSVSSSSSPSSSSSSSISSDSSTTVLHTAKPSSPAMLHSPASKSQDQDAKSPLRPKTSPAWSHQGPETNSPRVQKQQKPDKESPERDDLERYETALEDNPGHVADSLFEQDRIEAIQRGLNGCLRLSRQQLWQLVADAGMWDTVAKGLGALRGDSETVLPLLDLGSLASLLHLESGSLAVRQLHRALLDLVRVESIETAFEQHERGDIEKAAAGFEMDSSLQQWRPLVAIPFDQWTADHIAMLFRVCGAGERRGKPATFVSRCRVTGKYLLEREMQGSFCLEQELCSLGVLDSIVRQRLQYQISLLAKRVAARTNQDLRNELSGTDQAVMGGTVAVRNATTSLDDPEGAWWASRAFGLRARKPIKRWSVSDIGRLGKLLRFAPAILSRMEAYALDGRGFVDLTRDEMRYELGLSPHEVEVLDASRKLLLIPPQVLLGSSDYLQVRVLNQHESLWEAGGPEGKLCLALHRVHTLILRPGPGLMQAVDFASRKLERRHLLPAARIWFRLLEYTPGARDAAGDETKSFSDAGAASLTAVIRKHTIDTVGDRLRRWDPLHDLVQTRTGQLRGWRYLGTTSVERGCTDECARLDLAFNTAAFTSVLASKTKAGLDAQSNDNDATSDVARLYRFCFLVQLGTLKSPDSEFELVSVPLSNGIDSRTEGPGTHMFTLSAPFQIEPSKPSLIKTATRRKSVRKARRKSTLLGKKSSKKQIKTDASQRKNLPTRVAARNEPPKVSSPKVPKASRQSATHTRRLYRDDYKMEQIAKLEQTQRDMQATLKEALKHGTGRGDAQVSQLRTQAAYHLGELMGGQASKMSIHNGQVEAKRLPSALDTATVRIAKDNVSKPASSSISSSSSSTFSSSTSSSSSVSSSPSSSTSSSSSSSSSPSSSSSSSSQSPGWEASSEGEANQKITKRTSTKCQRDWTKDLTVAETQRKNDSDDEIDDELAAQWASRVSAQFLPSSPQGKTLTYPLRASSITADRCLSKLKRAVCRIGAASCLTYLAMHDRRYEGWISGSNFETFVVNDLNHPELVSELPEVLAELQTTHGYLARAQNEETVLRYERLVFRWTNESEAYRSALVQRLWRRAYLEEMDLFVALEPEGSPRHQVLRELDEDLDEDELHLVLGSRPNVDILDMPLIRLLGRSFWTGLIARLQPRATEFLDYIRKANNGQKTEDASSALLDVASFAEAVQSLIGIRLGDVDLEELQAASGGGEGHINCEAIVEAAQTRASVDTETVLLQLMAADMDATGIVDQEAMFTALCAGARGEGATRDHIDQARRLAADYGRNSGPFTLWMVSTLHLARERAIEAEFVRLGRWFARCELTQRNTLFDKLLPSEDDVCSYQHAQSVLRESGFSSSFWAELCALSGKYMKESEEWASTSAANDASKESLDVSAGEVHPDMLFDVALVLCTRFPETSSQEAARKSARRAVHGARIWRRISKLGGLKAFLSALREQDKACEGEVSLDSFCTALKGKSGQDQTFLKIALLQHSKEESATEVRHDRLPIAYESVLVDLLTDLRLEKVHFATLGLERIRRGLRKYHAQSGRPMYDICLTHDATSTGTVSMHELSWELGKLGVPLRCEGHDADFLQRKFGFKTAAHGSSQADIDYEMLVLEVSLLDAKGDIAAEESAKREFACQVLGRMLRGSGTYVGVLHFIDAEFPQCGISMEAESCGESILLSRLEKVFAKEPRPKLRRLAQALVESFSAEGEHVESKKRALRFDLLVEAMDSAPLDEARHLLWGMIEVASQKKINLYETLREVDGDLDGSLSLRMLNRALETVGVPTVSVGAVSLVDAMAPEDEVVLYEVFIERSEMYLARGSFESRLSAARLRAVLRRINASLLQQDQRKTARHAFVDLVSATESGQTDSVLSDWDLFFVLRNHKVSIQTFAELQTALAELLQKDVEKQSLEITLEIWLGLVASLE